VLNFKGEEVKSIQLPLPAPAPVTSDDLRKWKASTKEAFSLTSRGKAWFERFGKVIKKYDVSVYKKKPILNDISITPEGNILIVGVKNDGTASDFRLLNGDGKKLAKAVLNGYELVISRGIVFLLGMDEEENYMVHCFLRKGGETEDLKRIETLLTSEAP